MGKKKSEPLYKDSKLRIDFHPNSHEDHLLYIKENGGEEINYIIPRGVLREMALTPCGGIERMIATFNSPLLYKLQAEDISVDGLHIAICQAYAEEQRRINDYIRKERI